MKKERRNGFLAGILVSALVFTLIGSAAAAITKKTLDAEYSGIKIQMNGQYFTPTDVNGNIVEPFAVNGTTYLPVRAISNALGLDVEWDGENNTVLLTGDSGFLDNESALYISGKTLEASMFKVLADIGTSLHYLGAIILYTDIILTTGTGQYDLFSIYYNSIVDSASSIREDLDLANELVNMSYSDNQDMNRIMSNLENAMTSLESAILLVGTYDSNLGTYCDNALEYINLAIDDADNCNYDAMEQIRNFCYDSMNF